MWDITSLWFEISLVSISVTLGYIFFGHFEERTPLWKKLLKYGFILFLIPAISAWFGRTIALIAYAILHLPAVYIHAVFLPRHGINGWTGEPKPKYYALRGWNSQS